MSLLTPGVVWTALILQAVAFETYAIWKGGGITLSEGVWNAIKFLSKNYSYSLIAIGVVLGALYGHFFWCPCAIR